MVGHFGPSDVLDSIPGGATFFAALSRFKGLRTVTTPIVICFDRLPIRSSDVAPSIGPCLRTWFLPSGLAVLMLIILYFSTISTQQLSFNLAILHSWQKMVAQQRASLSRQMLQTPVVLNRFEGVGANFPPVATPTWRLQVAQMP